MVADGMTWALGGGLLAVTAAFIAMAFLNRKDNRELVMAERSLADAGDLADLFKHERDVLQARVDLAERQLADEQQLRIATETQRNEAQARAQGCLREHIKDATDDEIRRIADDVFGPFLRVSQAGATSAQDGAGGTAKVQPAGPTKSGAA